MAAVLQRKKDFNKHNNVEVQSIGEVPLPHNCQEILKHVDQTVDSSSKKKQLEQLYGGVFMNGKTKKYWVERGTHRNGFILFAECLSITWGDDSRYWNWPMVPDSSHGNVKVAELLNVCWLEVHGKCEMMYLSPRTVYEFAFLVKIEESAYGWEVPVNFKLTLPDGSTQEHKECLNEKPRGQWIEIVAGMCKTTYHNCGQIDISLYEIEGGKWKKGLVIKGIRARPLASY